MNHTTTRIKKVNFRKLEEEILSIQLYFMCQGAKLKHPNFTKFRNTNVMLHDAN